MPLITELSTEKRPNLSSMAAVSWSSMTPEHHSKAFDSLAVPRMTDSPISVTDDDARVPAMSDLGQEDRSLLSPDSYAVPQQEPELLFDTSARDARLLDLSSGAERLVPSLTNTPNSSNRAIVTEIPSNERCSPVAGAGASPVSTTDSSISTASDRRVQRFAPAVRAPARSAHGINFAITMTTKPQATPTSRNYLHFNYDSDDDEPARSHSAARASAKRRARAHQRATANKSHDWSESDGEASLDEFGLEHDQTQPSTKKAHSSPANRARKHKQCACCSTTSTPLWRDVRPNLPLCNACGIRFKKYGKICDSCHYVPCKSERDSKLCNRCGDKLPPASKPKMLRK